MLGNYEGFSGILVYDIIKEKRINIPYSGDQKWLDIQLVSTLNQDLVFVLDKVSINLKIYKIDRENSSLSEILDWDINPDLELIDEEDLEDLDDIPIGAFKVHYFTKVRIYLTTDDYLYVICPFEKTILQQFSLPDENLIELDIAIDEIVLNWSGEEIFLCSPGLNGLEVAVYYFCEEEEKHDSLLNFAKRAVFSAYTLEQLQYTNLPNSLKFLLGVV